MSLISNLLDKLNELCDSERLNPEDSAIICDAIDTIEEQSAKLAAHNLHGGWISCSERMPDDEKEVLACWEKHSRQTNTTYRYISILYRENNWWCSDRGGTPNGMVTHWMELPKLPEFGGK